jgi:hypothetical protein
LCLHGVVLLLEQRFKLATATIREHNEEVAGLM